MAQLAHIKKGTFGTETPVVDKKPTYQITYKYDCKCAKYFSMKPPYGQELLQHNNMATEDQRLGTAIEVLVQDMVHEKGIRSRAPSTVSVVSLKDSRRRRRQEAEQTALALDLPRSISVVLGNSASDISAGASEISAETVSKGGGESPLAAIGDSSTESASGGHGHSTSSGHPTMNEATGEGKDRCKTRWGKTIETPPGLSVDYYTGRCRLQLL